MKTFSIVIPSYNRPNYVAEVLQCLAVQYSPPPFEIIVVNDGGDRQALESSVWESSVWAPESNCELHSVGRPLRVRIINIEGGPRGAANARNVGADLALGDVVVFLDDDGWPDTFWLFNLNRRFVSHPDYMVGGPMEIADCVSGNSSSVASQLFVRYLHEYSAPAPDLATVCGSYNMAVPRFLFHRVGGYDSRMYLTAGDDRELWERWLAAGYRIYYDSDVIVRHRHVMSPKKIWLQFRRYGRGAYQSSQIAKSHGRLVSPFNTLSFQLRAVAYPLSCRYPIPTPSAVKKMQLSCLIALVQVAYFGGVVEEAVRSEKRRLCG